MTEIPSDSFWKCVSRFMGLLPPLQSNETVREELRTLLGPTNKRPDRTAIAEWFAGDNEKVEDGCWRLQGHYVSFELGLQVVPPL